MITKFNWPTQKKDNNNMSFNKRRRNYYIINDHDMSKGKTLMDATFEKQVAPLLLMGDTWFEVMPRNGDYRDNSPHNMLVSGPNKQSGLKLDDAIAGDILNLQYIKEDDDELFVYSYMNDGSVETIQNKSLSGLKARIRDIPYLVPLRNRKFLLTVDEYRRLYDDLLNGDLSSHVNFDIIDYKFEEVKDFYV